jgi:drug/metabolite transporter (DMT)-like permease
MPIRAASPVAAPRRTPIWVGLLILYLVWGSTYLGIAIAVDTIPPFLMAGSRFLIAGLVLLAWSIAREGRTFRLPGLREWRDSAIVGALLLGGGMGMVAFGEQTVPSGITALFIALMPVWVAVLGGVFLGERLPRLAVVGIVLGFVGVAILIGPSAFGGAGALEPLGLAAILISPIAWSGGSLFASHRAKLPGRPLVATGAQMTTGALLLLAMSVVSGELNGFRIEAISRDSLLAMAYLTVIGSLLAFTAYGWLLRVAPLPLIATYAYVNPIVAVILGSLVLREPIELRTLDAGAVIIVSVAIIVTARGRMSAPRSTGEKPVPDAVPDAGPGANDVAIGRPTTPSVTSRPADARPT